MLAVTLLALTAAVAVSDGSNKLVLDQRVTANHRHGIRDAHEHMVREPNSDYDSIRPTNSGADYSWQGVATNPEQNFCRHLASNLQDNRTGFEKTHADSCDGVTAENCEDTYIEAEAGNFQLCQYDGGAGACIPGRVHECTWTFYIEDMIRKQADPSALGSCYGEILEAKRSLDGLLHSVNETYAYLMLYNQIIHEENMTVREQLKEQQENWNEYVLEEERCMKAALQAWLKHVKPLRGEIEELESIAEPEVRSRAPGAGDLSSMGYTQNAAGTWERENSAIGASTHHSDDWGGENSAAAFIEVEKNPVKQFSGEMSEESCNTFTSLVERVQEQHGVKIAHKAGNCHTTRTELNKTFNNALLEIADLMNTRNQTVFDKRSLCLNNATYAYKESVEGTGKIDDKIQQAASRIHTAQAEVARLEPRFHDVEHAVVRMRHYIADISGRCEMGDTVTQHLKTIGRLIKKMQECPGRNDFTLTVPHWHHRPSATPSPTPWYNRVA